MEINLESLEEFYEEQLGYKIVNNKKMRFGITTGTVATAVSKAGAMFFLDSKKREYIEVETLNGKKINVLLEKYEDKNDEVTVFARKYAGDDIDSTHLALIYAIVKKRSDNEIKITGGRGVGIVTKEGLDINIGDSAINESPKKNIIQEVKSVTNMGFDIKICVEDGEEIAKKTFNERLGIEGGISIIGTTGIVEPMSEDSIKTSISKEIKVKSKNDNLILTFGNLGEKYLNKMGVSSDNICVCSNYVGYGLHEITKYSNIKNVLIAGNFAKAVKIAGGIFNTHSHIADAKNEIIAANLALMKANFELIKLVMNANTTRQINQYIDDYGYSEVYEILASKAEERCKIEINSAFDCHILMFDYDGRALNRVSIDLFL